jgi:hypothetical protein
VIHVADPAKTQAVTEPVSPNRDKVKAVNRPQAKAREVSSNSKDKAEEELSNVPTVMEQVNVRIAQAPAVSHAQIVEVQVMSLNMDTDLVRAMRNKCLTGIRY